MLSYDHQGGGGGGVLTSLTSTSFTLRHMYTLHMLSYDHQGGGEGCVLTSLTSTSLILRNMYTLRMLSYDHQGGWGWGGVLTSLTSASLRYGTRCLKKSTSVQKNIHLGLCCLVAVCGFCVAASTLALKRREEEKTGRVNVALI